MRALDLFCGVGGATRGLQLAGFHVTGVDIADQPNYCGDEFIQADAFDVLLDGYDFIWASPPCQGYSAQTRSNTGPMLIRPVRELLMGAGPAWAIENVMGAKPYMGHTILLCGTMFGLSITRHRLIECSRFIWQLPHDKCRGSLQREADRLELDRRDLSIAGKGRGAGTVARWSKLMGINWTVIRRELTEAIPPAYSEWVVKQALASEPSGPHPRSPRRHTPVSGR